jgi:hypothetical protein
MPLADRALALVSVSKDFLMPAMFLFPELVDTKEIFFLNASVS